MTGRRLIRRGSYGPLFAISGLLFVAFSALAVDVAIVRLAEIEAQAVADAAAQAALLRLRATDDRAHAEHMAKRLIKNNQVSGITPTVGQITFGAYQDGTFTATAGRANAVRVAVAGSPRLAFSRLWGRTTVPVSARASAAAQTLHTIVVLDITNSWNQTDFENARAGAVEVFDRVTTTAGVDDRIGMVVFSGQYGTEYTPLMLVPDALAADVRGQWANLRTASKAGTPDPGSSKGCSVYSGGQLNDFTDPPGGCFPHMPREYVDESGTDHAVGIEMATVMFAEHTDPAIYRAMIVLTDGEPNGTGAHAQRAAAGFEDTRWRAAFAGAQRGTDEVRTASITWAREAWVNMGVHAWTVSYAADAEWLADVAQGDGTYVFATNSEDLTPIFADIVESLPMGLVE